MRVESKLLAVRHLNVVLGRDSVERIVEMMPPVLSCEFIYPHRMPDGHFFQCMCQPGVEVVQLIMRAPSWHTTCRGAQDTVARMILRCNLRDSSVARCGVRGQPRR